MSDSPTFFAHFSSLPDPRIERCKRHALLDIVFVAVCAVMAGADGWESIEEFAHAKLDWLRRFIPLANGVPRHDTIARVMSRLEPEALQRCFLSWVQAVAQVTAGDVVAIDGKTLRRSFDRASRKQALHMVSAWSCANGLVLGQQRTEEKSNEIKAIPALLELLSVRGCIVTIDAMGCQKAIAEQIRKQKGDYVLAVKGNQPELQADIRDAFELGKASQAAPDVEETDSGHGRIEVRRCWQLPARCAPATLAWSGARSVAKVECERHLDGRISKEIRYYISSLPQAPARLLAAVRSHWAIENSLHWVLDVTFREDESRIRRGDAAENMTVLRRLALNICKRSDTGHSNRMKLRIAGWDDAFRQRMLLGAGRANS
jgi:predicted transposase YbfD/YdcC